MPRTESPQETILEPELPIIDPHHHLWDRPPPPGPPPPRFAFESATRHVPRYLLDDLLADLGSGHNIRATVYLECGAMYRADGPEQLKPVGETEFVNGVAAMTASGRYGEVRVAAGIVGHADLFLGDGATPVLEAHLAAGGGRFRGVRQTAPHDPDPFVIGTRWPLGAGVYRAAKFREGFARLAPLGLSFDAWLLEPQLGDVVDLARAFPDTQIILDHVGTPLGVGAYADRREERFPIWRDNIRALADLPNVAVKLGGLAMSFPGFDSFLAEPRVGSETLAEEWRPYIETCIEAFGPGRSMFESNFPVDSGSCDYRVLWNAFKRLAQGASADEKAALFSGTARRIYRLDV
jgi:predicted TIM-barrel fold metal-dependent hydrolase